MVLTAIQEIRLVGIREKYCFKHDLMWTAPGEIDIDREQHRVQSPKFMLTVVWNPIEFHVLKALPKGRQFSA
jgi:hypothetical protein